MMLLAGAFAITSCDKDVEWNPTLTQPTSFVLNNPAVGTAVVDLAKSEGIELSWSQPDGYTDMNAPIVPTYTIEISTEGTFNKAFDAMAEDNTGADYFTLDETTTLCKTSIPAAEIAKGIQQVCQYEDGHLPQVKGLVARVKAAVREASGKERYPIYSNEVSLSVVPYYIELSDADPNWWYLIGGDIADGKWADDVPTSLFPLQPQSGYDFDKKTGDGALTWTGYIAGNGFKLKKAPGDWDHQWGMNGSDFVENDGGSGNISLAAGYYTITLDTKSHTLKADAYDGAPAVYETIHLMGTIDGWGDGVAMSPITTFKGAINNHDWYIEYTLKANEEIKFNIGNWDTNWGSEPERKLSDGLYGYGTNNGPNIVVPEAGNYLIIFNDITGYYRLIRK